MSEMFNHNKTDYSTPSLFLGEPVGLFDTVNKKYPEIWEIYKTIKSLDWDENEFDYSSCRNDFKKCDKSTYDMMIKTLAFQWEADSVVSRIAPVVSSFVTSSELWAAWNRLGDQELIHAATYSEIVRGSFENPNVILDEVLSIQQAKDRLSTVEKALSHAYKVSHEYALGLRENNQETYNAAFMMTVALLILERIQFMASFAVTFAICDTGLFWPIGKAVQKIAQDEFETHVALDKAVLKHEFTTERGKLAYEQNKDLIKKMVDEAVNEELEWVDYLFSEGRELVGLNVDILKRWSLFCAKDVYAVLDVKAEHTLPRSNPLRFMENWLDISKTQAAPQEQTNAQYKVNVMRRDDEDLEFDI